MVRMTFDLPLMGRLLRLVLWLTAPSSWLTLVWGQLMAAPCLALRVTVWELHHVSRW